MYIQKKKTKTKNVIKYYKTGVRQNCHARFGKDEELAGIDLITDQFGNDLIAERESGEQYPLKSRRGVRKLLECDREMSEDVRKILFEDREMFMLREMVNNDSKKMVAIVGMAHLDGIESLWFDDEFWDDEEFWNYESMKVDVKFPARWSTAIPTRKRKSADTDTSSMTTNVDDHSLPHPKPSFVKNLLNAIWSR